MFLLAAALCLVAAHAFPEDAIEVVVSSDGFQPRVVKLHRGELAHLTVRAQSGEHCFAVADLRIEKRIRPGRPVVVDITPERNGKLEFYCCLDPTRERGEIVVSD